MHNLTAKIFHCGNAAMRITAGLRSSALAGMTVATLALGTASEAADLFTGKGLDGFSLQAPLNALGPIAPNGTWAAEDTAVVATGTTAPWSIQTAGAATWTDYRLAVTLTIRKPTPTADFPIKSVEYDRYLSRQDFPVGQHTGQYRYRYFAGEFDWGSDAALFVRHQNRQDCYRVQFSSQYQEIILWHGIGGYLQVVPWKLEIGKAYRVEVLAQGAHLQVLVDGAKAIDYWHECLPTLTGGIGLGAYQATVAFQDLAVTALPPLAPPPAHTPAFQTRHWRGGRWIFDGNEPLALLEKNGGTDPNAHQRNLACHFVKLRPGYRPIFFDFLAIRRSTSWNDQPLSELIGDVDDIKTTGEKSSRLTFDFDSVTADKLMRVHHALTLTYDAARGTYRYAMAANLAFEGPQTVMKLEFADPFPYNNKPAGKSVEYPWLYAGNDSAVVTGEDGKLYQHPVSQGIFSSGDLQHFGSSNPCIWMLSAERGVCPVWESDVPGESVRHNICLWGYDFHHVIWPKGGSRAVKAGDSMAINYLMTGYPPEEGKRILAAAPLHPNLGTPLETAGTKYDVPNPLAFAVCEPGGTSFAEAQSARRPFAGHPFTGAYTLDREIGHNDHASMRLEGPATINGTFFHHMLDSNATQYLCSVWIKTRGVQGKAPVVSLKYSYNAKPCDRIETKLMGDNDWRELSFLTTVPALTPKTYDSSTLVIEHLGSGTVWIDDFRVRPVAAGEKPTTTADRN